MRMLEVSFKDLKVGDVLERLSNRPANVQKSAPVQEALNAMLANASSSQVYIIDQEGNLAGFLTTGTIIRLIGRRARDKESIALPFDRLLKEVGEMEVDVVMEKAMPVRRETSLKVALDTMYEQHLDGVPVVDDDHKLIGELTIVELFTSAKDVR